jgi:hypothetical protein
MLKRPFHLLPESAKLPQERPAEFALCGWAAVSTEATGVGALRAELGRDELAPPLSELKRSDEQTVVGLAALVRAYRASGLSREAVELWAVVAAPRFVGRLSMWTALPKFVRSGSARASPTLIPYGSLHSVSGVLSLALRLRGGCFGVGGGPGHVGDGFLAAWSLLGERSLPGLWLVLTGWDPEARPHEGGCAPECVCHAVALGFALGGSPPGDPAPALRLRLVPDPVRVATEPAEAPEPGLDTLVAFLARPPGSRGVWPCPVAVGQLELVEGATAEHGPRGGPHFPRLGAGLTRPRGEDTSVTSS